MSEHTPGPWEAVMQDDPRGQPTVMYRGLICTVEHAPERYLAIVQKDGLTVRREQWAANARLIAAAPTMLWMLKDIRDFLKRSGYDTRLVGETIKRATEGEA